MLLKNLALLFACLVFFQTEALAKKSSNSPETDLHYILIARNDHPTNHNKTEYTRLEAIHKTKPKPYQINDTLVITVRMRNIQYKKLKFSWHKGSDISYRLNRIKRKATLCNFSAHDQPDCVVLKLVSAKKWN